MSDKTEFENWKQNYSNCLLDNQSLILEFELSDRQIGKKIKPTSLGITLFCGISLLILETLGNCLSFCIVWYEKFGMDSKKRTITNQLLSRMIMAFIFFNIFVMPLYFGSLLIFHSEFLKDFKIFFQNNLFKYLSNYFLNIDEFAYLIADFGFYRTGMHVLVTLAEMVIFKILYMYYWDKASKKIMYVKYFLWHSNLQHTYMSEDPIKVSKSGKQNSKFSHTPKKPTKFFTFFFPSL